MEPDAPRSRPTGVQALALSTAAFLLPLGLVACGSDDGDGAVSDPAPTAATSSATPTPTPTASPTVGTYPEFAPTDYTFQLSVSCFCLGAGAPIVVTVTGGEAVSAVYAQDGGGRGDVKAGDPADQNFWLTINDVIAQANNTAAEKVTVDWPDGQEYPNQVLVDQNQKIADDEIGYTIAEVQVTG